ncbi:NADP-dependent oxidoreductase [Paenibacillus durus]|nr:NADP-dependent oxidoreductase [Paenibacillus durus]
MQVESVGKMKAIRYHVHGGPEVLCYEDVPVPKEGEGEVLVRVHAAGVNPGDWQIRSGLAGDRFPLPYIPGWDISGVVQSVGTGVDGFREGDAVYGMTRDSSGCAEYAAVPARQLAHKPKSVSYVEAAGMPMSAFTAWHALFEQGELKAGQTALINGASGGVGHFAVQLAKWKGAKVIGVASGRNETFLRGLGVDQFVDYSAAPSGQAVRNVDLILDTVGGIDGDRLLDVLKPGGTLVPITWGQYSSEKAANMSVTVLDVKLLQIETACLDELARLADSGVLRIAIDSVFPLEETSKAHEISESRRARGKIIIQVK